MHFLLRGTFFFVLSLVRWWNTVHALMQLSKIIRSIYIYFIKIIFGRHRG